MRTQYFVVLRKKQQGLYRKHIARFVPQKFCPGHWARGVVDRVEVILSSCSITMLNLVAVSFTVRAYVRDPLGTLYLGWGVAEHDHPPHDTMQTLVTLDQTVQAHVRRSAGKKDPLRPAF